MALKVVDSSDNTKPTIQGLSTDFSSLATFAPAVAAADGAVFIEVVDAKVFLKHDGSWYNITGADSNV